MTLILPIIIYKGSSYQRDTSKNTDIDYNILILYVNISSTKEQVLGVMNYDI